MRTLSALIAAALIAGCATEDPEQPTYVDERPPEEPIDVDALYAIINAQADRISAFEARFDAAEAVDAQQTWDLDNSELWLQALTADIVALQEHAAAQDPILVNASAGVAELVGRMDTHTADTTSDAAARDARIDTLEDETSDQWMAVVDIKINMDGLQAGIDAGSAQEAAANDAINSLAAAVSQHVTDVSAALQAEGAERSEFGVQFENEVEALAGRVKTMENGVVAFEDIEVDASTRCEVGPEQEAVEYVLAVDVEPAQILMRWTEIDEVHIVDPLEVKCGEFGRLDYPGMPPAVVSGGDVYVVDPELDDGRYEDTIWRTITFN